MKKRVSETTNTAETTKTAQSVLSDIADSAAEGIQKGTEAASEAVDKTLPIITKCIRKGNYISCYYLAFGVVYGAKFAEGCLPLDSVIRYGLKDGGQAAREAYALRYSLDDTIETPQGEAYNPV
jgi:hypothetical protein